MRFYLDGNTGKKYNQYSLFFILVSAKKKYKPRRL